MVSGHLAARSGASASHPCETADLFVGLIEDNHSVSSLPTSFACKRAEVKCHWGRSAAASVVNDSDHPIPARRRAEIPNVDTFDDLLRTSRTLVNRTALVRREVGVGASGKEAAEDRRNPKQRRQEEAARVERIIRSGMRGAHAVLGPTRLCVWRTFKVDSKFPLQGFMPSCPLNIIGPQLRRLRYERGLSQPDLAVICQRKGWDISRDTVANIEGQRRWVADFELLLLALVLSVPVEALLPSPHQAGRTLKTMMRAHTNESPRRARPSLARDVSSSIKSKMPS